MMKFYQESTDLSSGKNLVPTNSPYVIPKQDDNLAVFLISGSFEYDLELIKKMPPPRLIQNIIIPSNVSGKIGAVNFTYKISEDTYRKKVEYLQKQKMVPQLRVMKQPINRLSHENVYVSLSDVVNQLNSDIRNLSPDYLEKNVPSMVSSLLSLFSASQ